MALHHPRRSTIHGASPSTALHHPRRSTIHGSAVQSPETPQTPLAHVSEASDTRSSFGAPPPRSPSLHRNRLSQPERQMRPRAESMANPRSKTRMFVSEVMSPRGTGKSRASPDQASPVPCEHLNKTPIDHNGMYINERGRHVTSYQPRQNLPKGPLPYVPNSSLPFSSLPFSS